MLVMIFDARRVIHKESTFLRQIISVVYYVAKRGPSCAKENLECPVYHHNNDPNHTTVFIRELPGKHNLVTLPGPPCIPNLTPGKFFSKLISEDFIRSKGSSANTALPQP